MAIVVFEHHPLQSLGRLGTVLNEHGHRFKIIQLHAGDAVPPDLDDVDGVIALGGPMNVDEGEKYPWMQAELDYLRAAHEAPLPVLGICLGAQLLAVALGGKVEAMETPEIGFHPVTSTFFGTTDPVLIGVPWETRPFHAHGYQVTTPPPGGTPMPLQGSAACKCQAFRVGLNSYGFQYHFEWTRETIELLIANEPEFYGSGPHAADHILASLDEHYDFYRHMGDRLCNNINMLMFPIDKRLPPSGKNVENFRSTP